jgi:purine nucleosidase
MVKNTNLYKSGIPAQKVILLMICFILGLLYQPAVSQEGPKKFFGEKKVVPEIPPKGERMRAIIVSDATNEIDDIWAIALALLYPERFDIIGFVGSNYDHTYWSGTGPEGIEKSVNEIHTILEKAGMTGRFPVFYGAHPMQYEFTPQQSEGIDFIIEQALLSTPDDPVWVISLGTPTDAASAYLKEPAIADRIRMFWHARTENTFPYRAHNFNIKGDMHAARMMFHSPLPLVLFDTGTHLTAGPIEETEKFIKPYGELGEYLYNYRLKSSYFMQLDKGYFDLGDIAALIDPDIASWEEITCPTVTYYMDYNWYETNGMLLRCTYIDRDATFNLLYDGLKRHFKETGKE